MSKPDIHPTETVSLDSLRPWPRNYNQHNEGQTIVLGSSLHTLGQFKNIVIWRDYIVAGHGLVEAAKARGYTEIEAKRLPEDWPEAKVEAVLAADNELAKLSTPDDAMLAGLLQDLRLENADWFGATGWDGDRLDGLLRELGNAGEPGPGADAEPQVDRAPELLQKWEVQSGDLWAIGEHRLVCGDCTDAATVAKVMGGEKADLAWFDPPFGIDLKPQRQKTEAIENDGKEDAQALWRKFLPILKSCMSPDTHLFLCQGWSEFDWTLPLVRQHFFIKSKVVWSKNVWGIGYYTRPKHEDILYCWNGKPPTIEEPVADVWDVARENAPIHAAEKPPELSSIAIEHFSKVGGIVIDWFAGVGGSMIACQNLQRKARAIELSAAYCAVILERMHTAFPDLPIERLDNPMSGTLTHE